MPGEVLLDKCGLAGIADQRRALYTPIDDYRPWTLREVPSPSHIRQRLPILLDIGDIAPLICCRSVMDLLSARSG